MFIISFLFEYIMPNKSSIITIGIAVFAGLIGGMLGMKLFPNK